MSAEAHPPGGIRGWPGAGPWPAALTLYAVLAAAFFLAPLGGHLSTRIVAMDELDPGLFIWMLGWWPHAIGHGLDPLYTHAMFAPGGYNLAWSTSIPLPAVLLAPLTLAAGPVVSFNVLQWSCPTLSAFAAYLLGRQLTARTGPALVVGYLFGFSPFVLANLRAAPNVAMTALAPLLVLFVLRRLQASLTPRRFVVATTLALTAQFLVSTEVFATTTLFAVVALVLAAGLMPARRRELVHTTGLIAIAYLLTGVLVSPYLYAFITGPHYPPGITFFGAQLAALVLAPAQVALAPHPTAMIAGTNLEDYVSLPLLAILVAVVVTRRTRASLTLGLFAFVALVLSLGGLGLVVRTHLYPVWMPWRLFVHLPLIRYAIPARFVAYVLLATAIAAGLWLATPGRGAVARWGPALLAVAAIIPLVGDRGWNTPLRTPGFFAAGDYRHYLRPNDRVLVIPSWGPSQRWLATAGFPFSLVGGSGGQGVPPSYGAFALWRVQLLDWPYEAAEHIPLDPLPQDYATEMRRFVAAKRVTAVLVLADFPGPWRRLVASLGVPGQRVGGMILYRIAASPGRSQARAATVRRRATASRPSAATATQLAVARASA